MGPGQAQLETATQVRFPVAALRKIPERLVQCGLGDRGGRETQPPNPWIKSLNIGT